MRVNIVFESSGEDFHLGLLEDSDFCMEFESSIGSAKCVPYAGPYTVIPEITAQTLLTENKHCSADIQIQQIPYYEVDNIQRGKTVIIGG
jgi:hypothetical protein